MYLQWLGERQVDREYLSSRLATRLLRFLCAAVFLELHVQLPGRDAVRDWNFLDVLSRHPGPACLTKIRIGNLMVKSSVATIAKGLSIWKYMGTSGCL